MKKGRERETVTGKVRMKGTKKTVSGQQMSPSSQRANLTESLAEAYQVGVAEKL